MAKKAQEVKLKGVKVTTPKFRVSFPHVFKPHQFNDEQKPKYQITMLFAQDADLSDMKKAVQGAIKEAWPDKARRPKNIVLPFKDGDEKADLDGYEGTTYCGADTVNRPQVIDRDKSPIDEESGDFYPGCYARASLVAKAYINVGGKSGVKFYLQNVQKWADGEPFGGKSDADADFDELSDDADDADNYEDDDDIDLGF